MNQKDNFSRHREHQTPMNGLSARYLANPWPPHHHGLFHRTAPIEYEILLAEILLPKTPVKKKLFIHATSALHYAAL